MYNLIYDMMEEDPDCGKMYWDHQKNSVALSFPIKGEVSIALSHVSMRFDGEDEDEEDYDDTFGIFN